MRPLKNILAMDAEKNEGAESLTGKLGRAWSGSKNEGLPHEEQLVVCLRWLGLYSEPKVLVLLLESNQLKVSTIVGGCRDKGLSCGRSKSLTAGAVEEKEKPFKRREQGWSRD